MTIALNRDHKFATQVTSVPPAETHNYTLSGINDKEPAKIYVTAATPALIPTVSGILHRQSIELNHLGHKMWSVRIPYGKEKKETGSYTFDFDTTGGTTIVYAGKHKRTFPAAAADNNARSHQGAIGVRDGEPTGASIVIPALKLNYKFNHPAGFVNEAHAVWLARLTGTVNDDTWHGFKAGELLCLGGNGSDGSDAQGRIAYQMLASENVTDLEVGPITGIVKNGHEVVAVYFKDDVDDDAPIRIPEYVNVIEVYTRQVSFQANFPF